MTGKVTINHASAVYIRDVIEDLMQNTILAPETLQGLHGRRAIRQWRAMNRKMAKYRGKKASADSDLELMEDVVFPVYLDVCAAMARRSAT